MKKNNSNEDIFSKLANFLRDEIEQAREEGIKMVKLDKKNLLENDKMGQWSRMAYNQAIDDLERLKEKLLQGNK